MGDSIWRVLGWLPGEAAACAGRLRVVGQWLVVVRVVCLVASVVLLLRGLAARGKK